MRTDQPIGGEPSPFESASPIAALTIVCAEGRSSEVALDDITDTGFAAEDILAYAEGEHRETIRWLVPEDLSVGPESGESDLTITVERASDRAHDFKPDTEVSEHSARCRPWITVDVIVTIQSEGGALNERFEATLHATDPRVAYLRAITPALELAGALSVTRESRNVTASSYELKMTLSEHGATGSLYSRWSRQYMDIAWDESFELAHWGRAHCTDGSHAVALDEQVELQSLDVRASASDGIAWLAAADPLEIAWEDGGVTTATLRFSATEDGACVTTHTMSAEPFQYLHARGELEIKTADGRVDARWPSSFDVRADEEGRVIGAGISCDGLAMPDGWTASPAELGFPRESRNGHMQLQVNCGFWIHPSLENGGTIELSAYDDTTTCDVLEPECVSSSDFTTLVRGDVLR